jgi:cell division protein FtsB
MRQAIIGVAVAGAVVWAGFAFVQEAIASHRLTQQVSDLRRQNVQITAQNQGYKRDVQAMTSGAGNEEDSRLNGFAKPNEKTFLVVPPPSPSPTPAASPSPSPSASPHR